MILFMSECKRVLKDTGTIWINLGDSYNSHTWANREDKMDKKQYNLTKTYCGRGGNKSLPNKSLMLIPQRFAVRCVDELGLILRNDIIWASTNKMPESVRDRFSKKHEFIFFFVKKQKYYFDLDSIRQNVKPSTIERVKYPRFNEDSKMSKGLYAIKGRDYGDHSKGANPGDVSDFWSIPTQPSSEKHYATFNTKLIDKPILGGSPQHICPKCKRGF